MNSELAERGVARVQPKEKPRNLVAVVEALVWQATLSM